MKVFEEVSDGVYPTLSSHGDICSDLLEQIQDEYNEACERYTDALHDVKLFDKKEK